jgi:hypothetical protein
MKKQTESKTRLIFFFFFLRTTKSALIKIKFSMLRRSLPKFSFFSVLKEELGKAKELLVYDLGNYGKFLSGEDVSEREKKIREKHQELAQKDAQAAADVRSKMSWRERLAASLEELKNSTKTNAAVVAMVQHCARAHMAEIAVEQDIDIRNIHIITEGVKNEQGVDVEEKVIGYIEAPSATNEEVMAYAHKLERACPAARTHGGIEWRRAPSTTTTTPTPNAPAEPISSTMASGSSSPSSSLNRKKSQEEDFHFPAGSGFGNANKKKKNRSIFDSDDFDLPDDRDVLAAAGVGKNSSGVDLPHGSPFHDKQKQDLGSFKPSKITGNEETDLNRTAKDLSEALYNAKKKTQEMEAESERRSIAEEMKKFREAREKEKLESEKEKSDDQQKQEDGDDESKKKKKGFGSLKQMGLFGGGGEKK